MDTVNQEKVKREKWFQGKQAEIKKQAMKGLEEEIEELMKRKGTDEGQVESRVKEEVQRERSRLEREMQQRLSEMQREH